MLENTLNDTETTPNDLPLNNTHQADSVIDIAKAKFEDSKDYAAEKLVDAKEKVAELTIVAEAKFEDAKAFAAEKLDDAKEKAAELSILAEEKLDHAKESAKGLWDKIISAFNTKKMK